MGLMELSAVNRRGHLSRCRRVPILGELAGRTVTREPNIIRLLILCIPFAVLFIHLNGSAFRNENVGLFLVFETFYPLEQDSLTQSGLVLCWVMRCHSSIPQILI